MKSLQEGLFDNNLISKMEPIDVAKLLKDSDLINKSDGSKDALGQPLKEGDIILVNDGSGTNFCYGVYIRKSGSSADIIKIRWKGSWPPDLKTVWCAGIIKLDKKFFNKIL